MKRTFALLLAALMLVGMLSGCGAKKDTFVMGIDPEYPPFSYMGDDGEYTGFDVEIAQAVCEKLGWELEIFEVNWDQKLVQLNAKECDCVWSGMTIVDSMKEKGFVISEPYYYNTQVLVVKEDSGIESSKDLAGKTVAVQLGTSGEALLAEDLKELSDTFGETLTCDSFLKCFTELEGNVADAVFVDLPVAMSYVKDHSGLKIIDEQLGAEEYGIAFRAGDEELCAKVQEAIDALVENGTYAKIAAKYPDIVENLIFLQE